MHDFSRAKWCIYESINEDPRTDEEKKETDNCTEYYTSIYAVHGDCIDNPTSVLPRDDDLEWITRGNKFQKYEVAGIATLTVKFMLGSSRPFPAGFLFVSVMTSMVTLIMPCADLLSTSNKNHFIQIKTM